MPGRHDREKIRRTRGLAAATRFSHRMEGEKRGILVLLRRE
jgi:hypothetical protein